MLGALPSAHGGTEFILDPTHLLEGVKSLALVPSLPTTCPVGEDPSCLRFSIIIYYCGVCVCGHMCHSTHVEIEDNLVESVLSFRLYVGSGDQTQVARLV